MHRPATTYEPYEFVLLPPIMCTIAARSIGSCHKRPDDLGHINAPLRGTSSARTPANATEGKHTIESEFKRFVEGDQMACRPRIGSRVIPQCQRNATVGDIPNRYQERQPRSQLSQDPFCTTSQQKEQCTTNVVTTTNATHSINNSAQQVNNNNQHQHSTTTSTTSKADLVTVSRQHRTYSIRSPVDIEEHVAAIQRSQLVQDTGQDDVSTRKIATSSGSGSEHDAARVLHSSGGGLRKVTLMATDEQAPARAADIVEEVRSKAAPISVGMLTSRRSRMLLGDHPEAVLELVEDPWKRAHAHKEHTLKCNHTLHSAGDILQAEGESAFRELIMDDDGRNTQCPNGTEKCCPGGNYIPTSDVETAASVRGTGPFLGFCIRSAICLAGVETRNEIGHGREVDVTPRRLWSLKSGEARIDDFKGKISEEEQKALLCWRRLTQSHSIGTQQAGDTLQVAQIDFVQAVTSGACAGVTMAGMIRAGPGFAQATRCGEHDIDRVDTCSSVLRPSTCAGLKIPAERGPRRGFSVSISIALTHNGTPRYFVFLVHSIFIATGRARCALMCVTIRALLTCRAVWPRGGARDLHVCDSACGMMCPVGNRRGSIRSTLLMQARHLHHLGSFPRRPIPGGSCNDLGTAERPSACIVLLCSHVAHNAYIEANVLSFLFAPLGLQCLCMCLTYVMRILSDVSSIDLLVLFFACSCLHA